LQVHVPQLGVQQAGLQSIDIGQVRIGPITVGDLVLNNADFSMSAAQGVLQNVTVQMSIHVSVTWSVHVGMPDWIPDINVGDTYDLGSLNFPAIGVGDIVIPGLNNIHVHIPSLTAQNMSVAADPLALSLHNATADQISATNTVLPTAGFSIAGLTLNSLDGTDVAVPAAHIDQATVRHLHGDPVRIPSFSLNNLQLPAAQIPTVSSTSPLDIPATLSTQSIGFDAGILVLSIDLTPSARSHIDHLEISTANASATVGQVVLHNVTLPYDVLNLTLSQVGITSVTIPSFNAA
jgi:hypothetical protein